MAMQGHLCKTCDLKLTSDMDILFGHHAVKQMSVLTTKLLKLHASVII